MFRYLILALMFISSVCYAHKVDGWWHTSGMRVTPEDEFSHSHPIAQNYPPRDETPQPRTFFTPINDDTTAQDERDATGTTGDPQPRTFFTPINDDTTAQDESGATGTATGDPVSAAPLESLPPQVVITPEPLMITEYMLRDWSKTAGGGLPQWIELYNPNAEPMRLDGYQFTHAYKRFVNTPWVYVTLSITELTIPASDTALIANRNVGSWKMSGISKKDVWVIPYDEDPARLKNGWYLADPNGNVVHRIGTVFQEYPADDPSDWDTSLGQPTLPSHNRDGYRVSYQSSPSGSPDGDHFYGNENDVGSPGFYETVPAAPSLQRPKLATTWGHLKRPR